MELVPIKVTIRRGMRAGKPVMKYPDFNSIPEAARGGLDWCAFVDTYGGWYYDRKSKMGQTDAVNPDPATQFGCLLVPEAFATEAIKLADVEAISEAEFEQFYNERSQFDQPSEIVNEKRLSEIRVKYGIHAGRIIPTPSMDATDIAALDPASDFPGIVANPKRSYAALKAARGFKAKALKK